MYFLLQSSIIFAVYWSNIEYHWTPNGVVVGLIAYVLAYLATVLLSSLADRCFGKRLPHHRAIKRTSDSP
jgi:hypothetical protein